ncbi:CHC2 zinc finger domain-containing protein [Laribacter hongkongensis]|nr:CHC2 zinc finger domain-containing protein [Laribacter hongkongensis]MCG9006634.1 CHC2 zinc finger domain-containing protein [Laribacter hongkongensis]MCG9015696.1 CHC2 zinc finger domain-containing protein [Laribacter hongkongensis]
MRWSGKGWQVRCPFHDDRHPSATAYRDGSFHCHACGAHCCDVLDFHRRISGLGFKQAAEALGAWRGK